MTLSVRYPSVSTSPISSVYCYPALSVLRYGIGVIKPFDARC